MASRALGRLRSTSMFEGRTATTTDGSRPMAIMFDHEGHAGDRPRQPARLSSRARPESPGRQPGPTGPGRPPGLRPPPRLPGGAAVAAAAATPGGPVPTRHQTAEHHNPGTPPNAAAVDLGDRVQCPSASPAPPSGPTFARAHHPQQSRDTGAPVGTARDGHPDHRRRTRHGPLDNQRPPQGPLGEDRLRVPPPGSSPAPRAAAHAAKRL